MMGWWKRRRGSRTRSPQHDEASGLELPRSFDELAARARERAGKTRQEQAGCTHCETRDPDAPFLMSTSALGVIAAIMVLLTHLAILPVPVWFLLGTGACALLTAAIMTVRSLWNVASDDRESQVAVVFLGWNFGIVTVIIISVFLSVKHLAHLLRRHWWPRLTAWFASKRGTCPQCTKWRVETTLGARVLSMMLYGGLLSFAVGDVQDIVHPMPFWQFCMMFVGGAVGIATFMSGFLAILSVKQRPIARDMFLYPFRLLRAVFGLRSLFHRHVGTTSTERAASEQLPQLVEQYLRGVLREEQERHVGAQSPYAAMLERVTTGLQELRTLLERTEYRVRHVTEHGFRPRVFLSDRVTTLQQRIAELEASRAKLEAFQATVAAWYHECSAHVARVADPIADRDLAREIDLALGSTDGLSDEADAFITEETEVLARRLLAIRTALTRAVADAEWDAALAEPAHPNDAARDLRAINDAVERLRLPDTLPPEEPDAEAPARLRTAAARAAAVKHTA